MKQRVFILRAFSTNSHSASPSYHWFNITLPTPHSVLRDKYAHVWLKHGWPDCELFATMIYTLHWRTLLLIHPCYSISLRIINPHYYIRAININVRTHLNKREGLVYVGFVKYAYIIVKNRCYKSNLDHLCTKILFKIISWLIQF